MQERNGVELLALAVEIYTNGFVVTLQAQSHGAVPYINAAPATTLALTDDCGSRYASQPYGASGEGARSDWQWRLAYRCTPALDPRARALRLEIGTLVWYRPDPVQERFVSEHTVRGPWVFAIALPANHLNLGSKTAS